MLDAMGTRGFLALHEVWELLGTVEQSSVPDRYIVCSSPGRLIGCEVVERT